MRLTASEFRKDLYRLLDEVIATGKPLQIERKSGLVEIAPVRGGVDLDALPRHDCIVGDPDALVHVDWSSEWHGDAVL